MKKLLLSLIIGLSATLTFAFPTMWWFGHDMSSGAKIIRDSSSNLYWATRGATLNGRKLTVQKTSPNGAVLWTRVFNESGPLDQQFSIRKLAVNSTHLFVLYQIRDNSGDGAVLWSWIRIYDLNDGGAYQLGGGSQEEWEGLAVNEAQVAVARRFLINNEARVTFFATAGGSLGHVPCGLTSKVIDLRLDANNNAYAVFQYFNHFSLVRASAAGGLAYQTTLDSPTYYLEEAVALEVDPVANRAYILMDATASAQNPDAMLYTVNATTGAQISFTVVRTGVESDLASKLTLLPGAGVLASAVTHSLSQTTVVRKNVNGSTVWASSVPGVGTGVHFYRPHAMDADGNLALSVPIAGNNFAIDKVNTTTGAYLGRLVFASIGGAAPVELITDAAGNYYPNLEYFNIFFARYQPARLSFSTNNQPGGANVTATITLSQPATADQVWTVVSSNSALVSVPATALVPNGSTSVEFPLTLTGVNQATNVSINVRHAGFINQQTFTLIPSVVSTVAVSPQVVIGGVGTTGTITLNGKAPAGGRVVNLSSSKTNVATVPASVNVAVGNSSTTFPISTFGVNANQGVVITATTGSISKTAFFAVNAPSLTSISVNPTTLKGGVTGSLSLNISGIAPAGGFSIVLVSGAPGIVFLSASTSVTAGLTSRTVSVPTAPVTTSTSVLIFATRSGIYRTATLTVTP